MEKKIGNYDRFTVYCLGFSGQGVSGFRLHGLGFRVRGTVHYSYPIYEGAKLPVTLHPKSNPSLNPKPQNKNPKPREVCI